MLSLLWIGMLFFYSHDVRAADDVSPEVTILFKYGNCPGSMPSRALVLRPYAFYLVATDPKTGVVEDMVYINGSEITYISGSYRERFRLKRPFVYKNISDVKVLMYVKTAMDEKMNGIDNQIYYGKPHGVDFQELYKDGGKPLQELGDSPFQIHGFSVLYQEFTKERSQLVELFRAGSRFKEDCSAFDEKQWIANHGLYRVCHNKILDWPTFENVYYMPWVGSYFETKCLSE